MPLPSVGAALDVIQPSSARTAAGLTQADMISGAIKIISATTDAGNTFQIDTNTLAGGVLIKHALASITTPTGAYTPVNGKLRTALAVTASGISMGYNRTSDGTFVVTMNMDGSTGNLSVIGTLAAGSVITNSVTVDGVTLGTISGNASTAISQSSAALSTANAAYNAVSDKLNKNSSDILSGAVNIQGAGGFKTGTVVWDGSGNITGGTGVAITPKGLVAVISGTPTITLDGSTGSATYAGVIETAQRVIANGSGTAGGQTAAVIANSALGPTNGVVGFASGSLARAAIRGIGTSGSPGVVGITDTDAGVRGSITGSGGAGVNGAASSTGSVGGYFENSASGGWGLQIGSGLFRFGAVTIAVPPNDSGRLLAGDGNWLNASSLSVNFASSAGSASTANTASSANTASTANNALAVGGTSASEIIYFISDNGTSVTLGRVGGGTATLLKA